MFERDADESVPARIIRWAFRLAIPGVFLVSILGPSPVVIAGIFLILLLLAFFSWGMGRVVRLEQIAREPLSFCLPGFRESLRSRYFRAASLLGLGCLFIHLP
jgi:hypothetical protein